MRFSSNNDNNNNIPFIMDSDCVIFLCMPVSFYISHQNKPRQVSKCECVNWLCCSNVIVSYFLTSEL